MKKNIKHTLLAVALSAAASSGLAAEKVLTVASWLPTTHSINEVFWKQATEKVEKITEGRVSLKIEYGLAPPNGLLELVEYGGADISWTYNGYFPGRFVTTKLIELPGYPGDSEAASVAHWKAHDKHLKKAGEYDGVELIAMLVHPPADLFMGDGQEIQSLQDLDGRKMRTGGGMANEVAEALKVSPILAPATKSYEMISGGMADGTLLPMDVVPTFRLYEAAPNAYSLPGGFYRGSFSIFMNEEALDDISEADQKALRDYFGEKMSADAGKAWQGGFDRGVKVHKEHGTLTALSEADIKAFADMTKHIKIELIKEIDAKGIDGQAAYDLILETMTNYQSQ